MGVSRVRATWQRGFLVVFLLVWASMPFVVTSEEDEVVFSAERLFPRAEEWILPPYIKYTFRAGAEGAKDPFIHADWKVEGPSTGLKETVAWRRDGRFESEYSPKLKRPGEYRLICTFVDDAGNRASVSWVVTVDETQRRHYGPYGRKVVRSTDPGTLVYIKGGTFSLGGSTKEAPGAHEVKVEDFWIGKYPVTAGEFCEFLNERGNPDNRHLVEDDYASAVRDVANGKYVPRGKLHYVVANNVTWFGASEYCKWLSARTGKTYRLPTAAEWEYAARGPEGRKYPWGAYEPVPGGLSISMGRMVEYGVGDWFYHLYNIDSFPAADTPEGVADMAGVGQWCSDIARSGEFAWMPWPPYPLPLSAWDSADTAPRILMGNLHGRTRNMLGLTDYWTSPAWHRDGRVPGDCGSDIGFRVVMEAEATAGR